MTVEELKKLIENIGSIEINTESIVRTEIAFERYVQRLHLIGLRIKGVNYSQTQEIVSRTNSTPTNVLNQAMEYILGRNYQEFKHTKSLSDLKDLFKNFVLPVRNQIAHGNSGSYDKDTITLCIKISIGYILEIEDFLHRVCRHSAFDTPKQWEATTVLEKLSDKEISAYKNVVEKNCWNKNKAKRKYEDIKFLSGQSFFEAKASHIIERCDVCKKGEF